jgi:hypothetical protein
MVVVPLLCGPYVYAGCRREAWYLAFWEDLFELTPKVVL